MKDKNFPQLGQKLIIVKTKMTGEKVEYVSQLVDIESNGELAVAVPIKNAQLVTLINGTKITVIYNNSESGMLEFEAEVVRKINGKVPLMYIRKISEITKGQRRNYFRLDLLVPIQIIKSNEDVIYSGFTKDISGGGLRMVTDANLMEGQIIHVSFELEDRTYSLKSKVRTKFSSIDSKNEVGIEFLDIIEIDRNDLIKYLFLQQRMLIKRGM
ncbi:flagellar brake protein [Acetoanaerobium noterae]|uniref:flagellar brake protein n=1 Tax=Acetoanaerobium noterae TaxID=745369 RepID=UPI0028A6D2F3|nr:PilZ domain-containing protein [Acetoanaerobium noterae]